MLESMRRGAQTWVAKLLFALLVLSFAVWGIADVFTGFGRGAIATVGDTSISSEEFHRAYQNELDRISREANQRITAEQGRAFGLDRHVLSQLVGGAAVEAHAHRLGLQLSDSTLATSIQEDPNFHGADGKFSRQGFDALLRQIGLSEHGFLNLRRKDELRTVLIGTLVSAQTVPKPLVDIMHTYNQEKRVIEWVGIDANAAVTVAEPDEAKLKELYEADKAAYMTPEYRKLQVLMLTLDDLKKQVSVTDEEIASAYEGKKDSFDTPEQRRVQQIAFKDKSAAEAALKALRAGSKTFADVAKDAGAKDTDVDLGLVTKRALIDPKVADAAFGLEKDKFSDVVEGRFATVVLRVTQIEPGTKRTLADVRDQVRDQLAAEKARNDLRVKHDEVEDNRAAGKPLNEIGTDLKLTFQDIAAVDARGQGPDGKPVLTTPDLGKIVSQGFSADAGFDSEGIELSDGGYAWVHFVSTEAPKQRPFEAVKDEVKAQFMTSERRRLVAELAKKLAERVNAGEPMTAIEAAAKGKVQKSEPITRKTQPHGLSTGVVAQAFASAKGRAGTGPSSDQNSEVVFRVTEIVPAAAPTSAENETLTRQLTSDLANQTLNDYTTALKQRFNASINEAELKSAVGVTEQ